MLTYKLAAYSKVNSFIVRNSDLSATHPAGPQEASTWVELPSSSATFYLIPHITISSTGTPMIEWLNPCYFESIYLYFLLVFFATSLFLLGFWCCMIYFVFFFFWYEFSGSTLSCDFLLPWDWIFVILKIAYLNILLTFFTYLST